MSETQAAVAEPLAEIELLRRELHLMKTAGIIEIAVRNPSVAEYMRHWEGRTLKAEEMLAAIPEMLAALKGVVAVADRKTVEFDRARAAIARAETALNKEEGAET